MQTRPACVTSGSGVARRSPQSWPLASPSASLEGNEHAQRVGRLQPLRKESGTAGSQCSYSAGEVIAEAYDSAVSAESTEPGKTGPTLYSGVETQKPELLAPALQNSQLFPEGFPNALRPARPASVLREWTRVR
jgi:hypothetical protein